MSEPGLVPSPLSQALKFMNLASFPDPTPQLYFMNLASFPDPTPKLYFMNLASFPDPTPKLYVRKLGNQPGAVGSEAIYISPLEGINYALFNPMDSPWA